MINIYCLKDPDTGVVFYVGQTMHAIDQRLKSHVRESHRNDTAKCQWIQDLLDAGKTPTIELIEQCPPREASEREHYWISHYFAINAALVNRAGQDTPVSARTKRHTPVNLCAKKNNLRIDRSKVMHQMGRAGFSTFTALAVAIGVTNQTLSNWFNGDSFSSPNLDALIRVLDCTPNDVLAWGKEEARLRAEIAERRAHKDGRRTRKE